MRSKSAFQPNGLKQIQLADTALFSDANLVSYWKLEGNSTDSIGSNTGTDTAITYGTAYGKFGQGATFNGSTSKITHSATSFPTGAGARTWSVWFKATALPTSGNSMVLTYYGANSTNNANGLNIVNSGGTLQAGFFGYANDYTENYAFTTGVWYHISGTFDGTTAKIYVNGSLLGSGSNRSTWNTTAGTGIMGQLNGGASPFNGSIDDVAVFSRALSAGEIQQLYFAGSTKAYYPLNGNPAGSLKNSVIAYYKLDSEADSIGSYTLTNTGTVPFNTGKIGNGADFTPNDSLNNNSVLWATSYPRSFAGWAKFDSVATGGDQSIFALGDGSVHYYTLKLRDSDDKIVFRSNNNTQAGDVDTGITATAGTWYHWVVVQNSATSVTIYINNTETNTAAATFTATVSQFYLGYLGRSAVWYMDGIIDEVGIWNRALTADEVSRLYNAGNGMQLETRALDFSGNANHGTETAITYTEGKFGQGAKFNGSTSLISVADNSTLDLSSTLTFSAWVKMSALPAGGARFNILGKSNPTGNQRSFGWGIVESSGSYYQQFYTYDDGNTPAVSASSSAYSFRPASWYNVIVTKSGTTANFFANGVFIGTGTVDATIFNGTASLFIGAERSGADLFNGSIDEVVIESRAWTAKEVETYYRKSILNYRKGFWANIVPLVLSVLKGSFTLTGKNVTFNTTLKAQKGSFTLTGKIIRLALKGWKSISKNVASWTNTSKNSATWTDRTKNSSSWTNRSKN